MNRRGAVTGYDCPTCDVTIIGATKAEIESHHNEDCNPLGILYE